MVKCVGPTRCRKVNYNHLIKYYNLLQNWQKLFTVEIHRNVNLSSLLLRTQLGRSAAEQLWQSFTTSILPYTRVGRYGGPTTYAPAALRPYVAVEQKFNTDWSGENAEWWHQYRARVICCCIISKFIDVLKWCSSLHAVAPPGGTHPPHYVYESSQPREQWRYTKLPATGCMPQQTTMSTRQYMLCRAHKAASSNGATRLSVCSCLSRALILGLCLLYRTLTGKPIPEVEPTDQRGRTATGSGRNGRRISFRFHLGDIFLNGSIDMKGSGK